MLSIKVFTLLLLCVVGYFSSPLTNKEEEKVKVLLDRLLHYKEPSAEDELNSAVVDIVERVYSYVGNARVARAEGDKCDSGYTASCKKSKCDQEHTTECVAICDAQNLGFEDHERYRCNCDSDYTGAYCDVLKQEDLCSTCPAGTNRCWQMSQSKSGKYCYKVENGKYTLLNTEDRIPQRSLEEISEMGRFADVVKGIMKRQMNVFQIN